MSDNSQVSPGKNPDEERQRKADKVFGILFFSIYSLQRDICFFQVSRWDDVKVIIAALLLTLVAVLVVLVKYFIEYEEVCDQVPKASL